MLKHNYAIQFMKDLGAENRGFQFNKYFNNEADIGMGNKGFLDIINDKTKNIYDFKFGGASWSKGQFEKYQRNYPDYNIQQIKPKK